MILEPHGVKTLKRRICSESWEENEKIQHCSRAQCLHRNSAGKPALQVSVPGKRIKSFQLMDWRYGARGKHKPCICMLEVYKLQKFRSNWINNQNFTGDLQKNLLWLGVCYEKELYLARPSCAGVISTTALSGRITFVSQTKDGAEISFRCSKKKKKNPVAFS